MLFGNKSVGGPVNSKIEDDDDGQMLDVTHLQTSENWRAKKKNALNASSLTFTNSGNSGLHVVAPVGASVYNSENKSLSYEDLLGIVKKIRLQHDSVIAQIDQQLLLLKESTFVSDTNKVVVEDELDIIVARGRSDEISHTLTRLQMQETSLSSCLNYYNILLDVATPALVSNRMQSVVSARCDIKMDLPCSTTSITSVSSVLPRTVLKSRKQPTSAATFSLSSCIDGLQQLRKRGVGEDLKNEDIDADLVAPAESKARRMMGPSLPSAAEVLMGMN
jgi:hypothetical protein